MSAVDKTSAYPDTVQPGLPRLGKTPKGWTRTTMSQHLYEERRPVDLKDDATYDLVTVKRARGGVVKRETKRGADISVKTQFEVKSGDFLISKRQIVHGACGLVPDELDGATVSNEYAVLRSRGTLDLEYLKYLSHSVYFQQTCFHSSIGVHIEKMIFKLDKWLAWEFDLPPLAEQKRICKILRTWDRAIKIADLLAEATRQQQLDAFRQVVAGERRLKGYSGEWRRVLLGELGVFVKGKGIKREDVIASGLSCIRYGEIYTTHNFIIREFPSKISPKSAAESEKLFTGDILFTCSGETAEEIGKCVAFVDAIDAYAGGDIIILRGHNQSPRFLGYALNAEPVIAQRRRYGQGHSVVHISAKHLAKLELALPPYEEQEAIADMLDAMDKSLSAYRRTKEALLLERAALLKTLASGQRRAEASKEAA